MITYLLTTVVAIALILMIALILLHIGFIPPRIIESKTPADFAMDYKELEILTANNKKLFSWFIATKESAPLIIIMHGWGSNSELMLPIAATFYHAGMNVQLLDSRCHGKSEWDTYSALPRFSEDINHTIEQAKQNKGFNGKIILLGHSVGAGAVLYSASKRDDISAVISVSAFGSPQWLMTRYFQNFKLPGLIIKFLNFYIQWIIGHQFKEIAPVNTIRNITIPTLIVHGTHDSTVPLEDAYAIQKNNSNGRLLIIEEADHDSVDKIETHGQLLIDFLKQENLVPSPSSSSNPK
ncbi:MAG: alpha/beta fold hydrolase [gamma proteobacterium symbiont of Taylorina sp.]|nr:alpha/beta fold hydrolase [gamma proteobacterium symbiont of Taylorina sp.]